MSSRYQIVGEINQGGVGIVFKAWDTRLQRHVAIKRFLTAEHRADAGDIENDLLREAAVLSALQHPNIVSIHDVEVDEVHGPCVVMEYLNGKDLEQAVSGAALTVEDFYKVAEQTLDALSSAHRMNLLHRDIKPSNIQVTWLANGKFVSKFVDFGLARFFEKPSRQTVRADGTVMGSIFYMSPEQLERLPLDHRSDLYSLGCVFYFVLSMHRPFEGATVQEVITSHLTGRCAPLREYRPNLAPALCRWVEWLIRRNPEDRPEDAEHALAVLRQITRGQAVSIPANTRATANTSSDSTPRIIAPPVVPPPAPPANRRAEIARQRKAVRKSGPPWPALAAAAAVLVGGGGFGYWKWKSANAPVGEVALTAADLLREAREETAALTDPGRLRRPAPRVEDIAAAVTPPKGEPIAGGPPAAGLVLWFDAAQGAESDPDGTPATERDGVCRWLDQSELGGHTELQYYKSSTKHQSESYPRLVNVDRDTGLSGVFPALRFADHNLVIRDSDGAGPPLGAALDKAGLTVFLVFRSTGGNCERSLISARDSRRQLLWAIGLENGGLVASSGERSVTATPVSLHGSLFELATVSFDFASGKCQRQLVNAAGEKSAADSIFPPAPVKPLSILRIGREDSDGKAASPPFKGEIAELLVYHSTLPEKTRLATESYLRTKYFGAADGAVAAGN